MHHLATSLLVVSAVNSCTPDGEFDVPSVAEAVRAHVEDVRPALLVTWEAEHGPEWIEDQLRAVLRARRRRATKQRKLTDAMEAARRRVEARRGAR